MATKQKTVTIHPEIHCVYCAWFFRTVQRCRNEKSNMFGMKLSGGGWCPEFTRRGSDIYSQTKDPT